MDAFSLFFSSTAERYISATGAGGGKSSSSPACRLEIANRPTDGADDVRGGDMGGLGATAGGADGGGEYCTLYVFACAFEG